MWQGVPPSIATIRESSGEGLESGNEAEASASAFGESPASDARPTKRTKDTAITRRSHRKSRLGCQNCKKRRIKCDEGKPECTNCKKRQIRCDYMAAQNSSASPATGSSLSLDHIQTSEVELTYYWATSTCYSLSAWPAGAVIWRNKMVEIGLQHQHLLHLVFALTAFHLAFSRPSRREEYVAKADHHYALALPSVTTELSKMNFENCDAVYTSVQLVCFVGFARGPRTGEYLAFGHGRSDWLIMFRGIRTTMQTIPQSHFARSHAPSVRAKQRPLHQESDGPDYAVQLQDLHAYVHFLAGFEDERNGNAKSVDTLIECYEKRYTPVDSEYHIVFGWLYRMDDEFLNRLQQHEPGPLIIYAHFVVLLYDMERFWYMRGWTNHIMSGIYAALPDEFRAWLDWPMMQIQYIPP